MKPADGPRLAVEAVSHVGVGEKGAHPLELQESSGALRRPVRDPADKS